VSAQTQTTTARLLSLSQVARRLDVTQPRATEAVRTGAWVPDFTAGKNLLFQETRLDELRERLAAAAPAGATA
jgi:hypothetical protein